MPWALLSDTFASHPSIMAVGKRADADDSTTNEVRGFVLALVAHSARQLTDGLVDVPTARMYAEGDRTEALLRICEDVGLLVNPKGEGRSRTWELVEDQSLWHVKPKAQVEWDRQRDRDRKNRDLWAPVRFRDGDECRRCGRIVNWSAAGDTRASSGTLDHLEGSRKRATTDTVFVVCRSCNSARKDDDTGVWDRNHPLLPAPATPFYSEGTVAALKRADPVLYRNIKETKGIGARRNASRIPGGSRTETKRTTIGNEGGTREGEGREGTGRDGSGAREAGPKTPEANPHTDTKEKSP